MTYDFALDKKAVISLIAGSVVIAALLFVAGLIVGRQWFGTDSVAVAHAAENERAALPTEPVLNEEAVAPSAAPKAKPAALPLPKGNPARAGVCDSHAPRARQFLPFALLTDGRTRNFRARPQHLRHSGCDLGESRP